MAYNSLIPGGIRTKVPPLFLSEIACNLLILDGILPRLSLAQRGWPENVSVF